MNSALDTRAVAQGYFDALANRDFDSAVSFLADDIVLTEAVSLPYGGIHHGPAKFKEALGEVAKIIGADEITLLHLIVDGERAAAHVRLGARSKQNGQPVHIIDWMLIRGGKIIELTPFYYDTASILADRGTPPLP